MATLVNVTLLSKTMLWGGGGGGDRVFVTSKEESRRVGAVVIVLMSHLCGCSASDLSPHLPPFF